MGHDITSPIKFRASSLFLRFEAEALLSVLDAESIGADATTDLVFVNIKGTDYVAHAYGPDSPEMKEALSELDRQMAKLVALLNRKAAPGHPLLVITGDHGMPSPPAANGRHYVDEIVAMIHEKFDPANKAIVQYFGDPANAQIYIDVHRLDALHLTLKDVAGFLAAQSYIAAAFTEDEVKRAAARLPRQVR
jgi:predicted AlkP superfamily pyrophosphatase or phosphodiesterase